MTLSHFPLLWVYVLAHYVLVLFPLVGIFALHVHVYGFIIEPNVFQVIF
jgi:hypothetical protein